MDEVPFVTEAIEGWRAWRLVLDGGIPSLVPVGKGGTWPRLRMARARCLIRRRHQAPDVYCSCGLYATSDPALLRRARSPAVVGTVALWGRVVEHTLGWRGEFAYPQQLALVCHVCLSQRGVASSQPGDVVAGSDRSLVPLCERHLHVAQECDSPRLDLIPARLILAGVTESYATEPLVSLPDFKQPKSPGVRRSSLLLPHD